jgi:phosphoribosyl 1,2-cyclic phosphodiesterase
MFSILGSGASSSTPWLQCLISGKNCCAVCDDCRRNPLTSRNIRNNVSALLSVPSSNGIDLHHVMIDAGKTMRQSVMKWFPTFGVQALAAVVLTHPHADAFLGLDDLRDLSPRRLLPVYLSRRCFDVVKNAFSYLVPEGSIAKRNEKFGYGIQQTSDDTSGGGAAATVSCCAPATTFVAMIEWRIFNEWEPFVIPEANNVIVTPVPVQHGLGRNNISFAFEFGLRLEKAEEEQVCIMEENKIHDKTEVLSQSVCEIESQNEKSVKREIEKRVLSIEPGGPVGDDGSTTSNLTLTPFKGSRILYISDVSSISPTARLFFRARPTDLLILDLLNYARYSTHFNAQQAVNCAADIRATKARFVGINHAMDHEIENEYMQSIGSSLLSGELDLGLARDGLRFSFTLSSISSKNGLETLRRDISSVRNACSIAGIEEDDPSRLVDYYEPILVELLPENSPTKTRNAQ